MSSNRYIRQAQYQKQIKAKKKKAALRKRLLILQTITFILVSTILFSIIFLAGNNSLAKMDVGGSEVLNNIGEVSLSEKADNSFLVQELNEEISSTNAILIGCDSGEVIAAKGPDEKVYPASMTKVMTAVIVLEYFEDLTVKIEMPQDMYDYLREQNASVAGFLPGEKVQIIDLLYGVMLPSGADACLSLARAVSGSEAAFAKEMTKKAQDIGALNTNFVNSTGLHDDNHYTTVRDMSKIVKYALQNDNFRTIFTTETYTTQPTNKHSTGLEMSSTVFSAISRTGLTNNYIIGGKTGYTGEACLCLASLGKKKGNEYILITVGAGTSTSSKGTHHVKDALYVFNNVA